MAKSFYEGLFGFDKDMKMIPVLAESYDVSKDGLVYTIKLQEGRQVPRRHRLQGRRGQGQPRPRHQSRQQAEALRPLQNNIAKTEVVDDYTARITLKTPFSPFISTARASVDGDDQPGGARSSTAARTSRSIRSAPGPFKFVEWKATDYLKVAKFDGYWKKGYPKVDTITWKPVVDNNSRAAMMQTGEAHFTFPVPYEMAEVLKAKPDLDVVAAPSIVAALPVDEHAAEAVRQPEGAPGDRLRDQQGGASPRSRSTATRRRPKASCRRASSTR